MYTLSQNTSQCKRGLDKIRSHFTECVDLKQDDEVIQYTSKVSDIKESQHQLYYRSDNCFWDGGAPLPHTSPLGLCPRPRVCGVAFTVCIKP